MNLNHTKAPKTQKDSVWNSRITLCVHVVGVCSVILVPTLIFKATSQMHLFSFMSPRGPADTACIQRPEPGSQQFHRPTLSLSRVNEIRIKPNKHSPSPMLRRPWWYIRAAEINHIHCHRGQRGQWCLASVCPLSVDLENLNWGQFHGKGRRPNHLTSSPLPPQGLHWKPHRRASTSGFRIPSLSPAEVWSCTKISFQVI